MRTNVWIYNALAFIVVSLVDAGRGKKSPKYELQRYEKTESHMLACPGCPQVPRVQSSRSQEHCARKCKKGKTHFNCRAFNFEKHNRKCHLLAFDRLTQGAQTQASVNFTLYESKGFSVDTINPTTQQPMLLNSSSGETYTSYIRECIVGTKDKYRGRRSRTKSNIACQAWSDNNINDHTFYPHKYPRQDLRENFCRNPNNDPGGPWCYTTDPNVRSEDCGLQQCSQQVCMTCNGEDYEGKMDHTESGKECQRWDASRPHKHPFKPKKYRDQYFKDNYCRNPDNRLRPWCYTLDAKVPWEYCNISVCDSSVDADANVNVTTTCVQGKGTDYRGTMNITPEGVSCQRWDSQFPHNHSFHPHNYKCKDLQENYCRNPDGSDYPWCFTTDPNQRKANCTHIPKCDAEVPHITECYEDIGENYRGTLSMTRSGIPCGDWSNHINSGDSHSAVSDVGLDKNYCRNPDRDKHGPWCYTNANSRLSWDYCKLKRCESGDSPTQTPQPKTVLSPKISCFVHINTRIVGGHQVHGADGSWVVSIQRENDHLCGGSLIREDWVLTDQQCFTSCVPDLSDYSVQVGLRHLNQSSSHPRLRIARLICGPEGSNLVLLKLARPAPVSEGASDIHLPVKECSIAEGTNCTMYGWGETKNTGYDEALKAVTLPMVNNDMCTRLKGGAGESRVCAGGRKGEGMCEKDNGGPLVCQEHERKVIIGVSIQRTKCASSQPALFVNVAFYSGWIYKVFKCYPS